MFQQPKKTIVAYKLFRTMPSRQGEIFPLFINKSWSIPIGEWVTATNSPTKGFAERPGWHAGVLPMAPHLRTKENKIASDRVWAKVELPADVDWQPVADKNPTRDIRKDIPEGGYYKFKTNKMQGWWWLIGGALKVNRLLSDDDVSTLLTSVGEHDASIAERHISGTNHYV